MSALPAKRRLNAPLSSETLSPSPGARMSSQTLCNWVSVNRSGIRCSGRARSLTGWFLTLPLGGLPLGPGAPLAAAQQRPDTELSET